MAFAVGTGCECTVHEATGSFLVADAVEQLMQRGCLSGPSTSASDTLAREVNAQVAGQLEDTGLGRRVSHLGTRGPRHRQDDAVLMTDPPGGSVLSTGGLAPAQGVGVGVAKIVKVAFTKLGPEIKKVAESRPAESSRGALTARMASMPERELLFSSFCSTSWSGLAGATS